MDLRQAAVAHHAKQRWRKLLGGAFGLDVATMNLRMHVFRIAPLAASSRHAGLFAGACPKPASA